LTQTHATPDDFAALAGWIDERADDLIERVQAWSRINSGSGNLEGLDRMGAAFREAAGPLGARYERREPTPAETITDTGEPAPLQVGPVHRFVKRPTAPRRVLLTGHIDTVFPAESAFQEPVFREAGVLNGPGVADMKGGLLVMLTALEALERTDAAEALGWEMLISSDEEIGSPGSADVLAERAPTADFGLTYEPALADGTLAGARKGSGNFAIVVRGRAAHAGREFDKGRNAVAAMADLIRHVDELNGRRHGVTVNCARISGGVAPNIVPDRAVLRVNARVPAEGDARWVELALRDIVAEIDRREGFSVSCHGGFNRPPKPLTAENERLFEAVRDCGDALGLEIAYRATGGCCEGNNLAAAGLPNVDTLGVRGGQIHSADEFVLTDSFAERAKLSALILLRFAEGAMPDLERANKRSA